MTNLNDFPGYPDQQIPNQGGVVQGLVNVLINGVQVLSRLVTTMQKAFTIWNGATATSATSGTASALPATPAGYMIMTNPATGATQKVPFYNL